MWNTLEEIAVRESLPMPLHAGDSIRDVVISGQTPWGHHHLHHLGRRRSIPYLLKQFYSVTIDAFLRWQNEARFITVPQAEGYIWPCEEWRGGTIAPFPSGPRLDDWLASNHSTTHRIKAAASLTARIAALHEAGIAHRRLSPSTIHIAHSNVTITDFSHALCRGWDDLWTDSYLEPSNMAYVSPEQLQGCRGGPKDDVYALGGLLYTLFTGTLPFKKWQCRLRPFFPHHVNALSTSSTPAIPPIIASIIELCLQNTVVKRPTIREIVQIMRQEIVIPATAPLTTPAPSLYINKGKRRKIMIFISNDHRAIQLFDAAIAKAKEESAMLLFVGLVPGNLPSGHLERYKGALFRKIGHGLMRCRSVCAQWSVRVIECGDIHRAAQQIIGEYRPDLVLLGRSHHTGNSGHFRKTVSSTTSAIEDIS